MLLNIINLIKIYNSLNDDFFTNEHTIVSSIEEFLDLKLMLNTLLKSFIKKLSIYFISLFKSYNKLNFTPLDNNIDLPKIYLNVISSLDILSLSGIFSISEPFNTNLCVYINNAYKIMTTLLLKHDISISLMETFLKDLTK